jgi:hypothetical protein
MRLRSLLLVPLVLGLFPFTARADLITFEFNGTVHGCFAKCGSFLDDVMLNQPVYGYYTFDSNDEGQPLGFGYVYNLVKFGVVVGPKAFPGGPAVAIGGDTGTIYQHTEDDSSELGSADDDYSVTMNSPTWVAQIHYYSQTSLIVPDSRHLSTTPPNIDEIDNSDHALYDKTSGLTYGFVLSSLRARPIGVPEPTSAALFGIGIVATAALRTRRRRRSPHSESHSFD